MPAWPQTHTYVHPTNQFGAKPRVLPGLQKSKKTRLNPLGLWCCCAILVHCPSVFRSLIGMVSNTWDWPGWLATYTSSLCFRDMKIRGSKNNPFRKRMHPDTLQSLVFGSNRLTVYDDQMVADRLEEVPCMATMTLENFQAVCVDGTYTGTQLRANTLASWCLGVTSTRRM